MGLHKHIGPIGPFSPLISNRSILARSQTANLASEGLK